MAITEADDMNTASAPTPRLVVTYGGHQEYAAATRMQELLVARKLAGDADDYLLFVTHPPVVTVGRGATEADELGAQALKRQGMTVVRVSRGGRLTYHGPGQIVGYPIVNLSPHRRDLHAHMRDLESVIICALAQHGVQAHRVPDKTGVWLRGRKVAAIGIAVRSWVTYHGFALNVAPDLRSFAAFSPCGLDSTQVSSLAHLGLEISEDSLRRSLASSLAKVLQRRLCWVDTLSDLTANAI